MGDSETTFGMELIDKKKAIGFLKVLVKQNYIKNDDIEVEAILGVIQSIVKQVCKPIRLRFECPTCGDDVLPTFTTCNHCGQELCEVDYGAKL